MRMWISVCADYLYRDVVRTIPSGRPATSEEFTTARTALERADALVGPGPYLVEELFTLADLCLAPQIANAVEKAPNILRGLTHVAAWMCVPSANAADFQQTAR